MRIEGQEAIADVLGVSAKTVVQWQEAGMPVLERGRPGVPSIYESADCVRWCIDREVTKAVGEKPKDRLDRVRAEAIEMDMAVKRGQLIAADAIEPRMRAAIVSARELLSQERSKLARDLQGKTVAQAEEIIRVVHDAFLIAMSRWNQDDDAEGEGDAS